MNSRSKYTKIAKIVATSLLQAEIISTLTGERPNDGESIIKDIKTSRLIEILNEPSMLNRKLFKEKLAKSNIPIY